MSHITQSRLKELLTYDVNTGVFTRNATGLPAGSIQTGGYRRVRLDGRVYLCHRLVWLYLFDSIPKNGVDHINGIKNDNRLCNLREADQSENAQNQTHLRANKSGFPGVTWDARLKKWKSRIRLKGKETHLGLFDTPEEASLAYLSKKRELHPFFTG